jgi:hypothetical protein
VWERFETFEVRPAVVLPVRAVSQNVFHRDRSCWIEGAASFARCFKQAAQQECFERCERSIAAQLSRPQLVLPGRLAPKLALQIVAQHGHPEFFQENVEAAYSRLFGIQRQRVRKADRIEYRFDLSIIHVGMAGSFPFAGSPRRGVTAMRRTCAKLWL